MKQITHYQLGLHLADQYIRSRSPIVREAFLLGCTQPDQNPFTYMKGSLRNQWLRGHNWKNSRRYIRKLIKRLENKKSLNILDFYTIGKLIHYLSDAFTFAHNDSFPGNLQDHRQYESQLHAYVLKSISNGTNPSLPKRETLFCSVRAAHQAYCRRNHNLEADAKFICNVTAAVIANLLLSYEENSSIILQMSTKKACNLKFTVIY